MQSDDVDMDWIETEVARKIALRDARMDAALADFDGPHAVVDFDALNSDWKTENRTRLSPPRIAVLGRIACGHA